jgi:hypothetical protein
MPSSKLVALAGMAVLLTACNRPTANHQTNHQDAATTTQAAAAPFNSPGAPPAPPMREPVPANANAAAPGTNASVAFANETIPKSTLPPSQGGSAEEQHVAVSAQEAAAKAPDTASADAAKQSVLRQNQSGESAPTGGARDTPADSPRHGSLTKQEESTEMPKAGQVNNYSSPALEKDSGR